MNPPAAHRVLAVIPARLGSERLSRKVLRTIHGKLLVEHVYARAVKSSALTEVCVATDAEEVFRACQERHIPVLMTSPEHTCGTDRVYEVMRKKSADLYVNIQGDEPLVRPEHLDQLVNLFSWDPAIQVGTLKTKIPRAAASVPSAVKVVTDSKGWALYFSRSVIPFDRDDTGQAIFYRHLGFYAYRPKALELFHRLHPSSLEAAEKLEQLRFLENGVPIFVAETPFDTIGVDTEEDLKRVETLLHG